MKKRLLIGCCAILLYCQNVFAQAETQNTSFPFWKINGNAGTNSSTNFLGTTDNVSLRFRANNQNYMVLDSNGVVGIGITKTNLSYGYAKFEVASEGIAPADILLRNAVNNAGYAPGLIFQHARGTLSAPTAVLNGDYLAAIQWQNFDGASYIGNAGINVWAEGAVSVGTIPTRIDIYTNGGSVSLNRLGNVGIGITAPLQKLHVNGSTSGVRIGGLATGGSFIAAPAATTDKLLYADANGDVKAVANGSNGSTLTINGSGVPAWAAPGAATEWLLTGNSSTVDGVNFLGTTDNVPFTIRTNNQQSGRVDPLTSNAFWGYWAARVTTGTQNVAVGTNAMLANTTGALNTAIGNSSLQANTTISGLTAVGAEALFSTTSGQYLSAVGYQALRANTSGFHGTAMGYNSQYNNTTGSYNVSSGAFSLYSNQTGSRNTAVGTSALYGTTSSDNTAVGYEAINQNGSSRGNSAVGSGALRQLTSGNYNVAIGDSAGFAHTSASRNVAIGAYALRNNTTTGDNLALGDSAAFANTSGTKHIAIGNSALRFNTISDGMIGIGYRALYNETSGGFYNIALGQEALYKTSGAQNNVAIGQWSQHELNSGSANVSLGNYTLGSFSTAGGNTFYANVAIGHGTALNMRTGYWNNIIGTNAGTNMLSSYRNNALGYYALYSEATGYSNTAIGTYALQLTNGTNRNVAVGDNALWFNQTGNANTAVGYFAGNTNINGTANTFVGDSANVAIDNLTNATALGAYAQVGASNSIVLGSINGVNNATSNVNVGIGTTTPARPLEIATGQLRFSNFLGDIEFTESADFHSNVTTATPLATAAAMRVHSNSTLSNVLLTLQHNGNMGLGTTTPTNAKFITQGVVGNTVAIFTGGATGTAAMGISMVANWPGIYFNSYFNGTTRAMANTGYPAIVNTDQSNGGLVFATSSTANTTADATVTVNERMRITGTGLVGIAQGGPGYYLELGFNSGAKPGSTAWTIPSDKRLKKDIEPFADGLSVIEKINPVWYRYNGQGGIKDTSRFAGIIAQELQQVAPYMIGTKERTNTDGSKTEYLDYDANAMTYLLVNSVKELKAQNDLLQQQIKQLQNRLDERDKQK